MELNREQIIKALECCIKVGGYRDAQICNDCPLHEERCALLLPQNALSLIKELTEENERLRAFPEKLKKYYHNLSGKTLPAAVEYHIDQIAKEILKEEK